MSHLPKAAAALSHQIWDMKYRLRDVDGAPLENSIEETWDRVAQAVAAAEAPQKRKKYQRTFREALADFAFLPGGRILAGAGSQRALTLFNCFVMGRLEDDMGAIFDTLKEGALTLQQGGGIGQDFSPLRPRGTPVRNVGASAAGPVAFMEIWNAMCGTILSAGARRGAMMATLSCDHPDILAFVDAKGCHGRLSHFNLSVLVTDRFIQAVRADASWDLTFEGKVYHSLPARELWDHIMRATYDHAEPGVIFIDRINARNNLAYCETIFATNPCGEQPLPPYGACMLGSVNLTQLVRQPFTEKAHLDETRLEELVHVAVRFLDNVIDVSPYPLPPQREEAFAKRRIGLGITGLANALMMCGLRYGSEAAAHLAGQWMKRIAETAYLTSTELAREKGSFPLFDKTAFLQAPMFDNLDPAVARAVEKNGIRNGLLTSIAPTGTISLLAGNVSSGIEPVFDYAFARRITLADGSTAMEKVEDFAIALFRERQGETAPLPAHFVRARDIAPREHLVMQAAMQRYVDSAISKTINCAPDIAFSDFQDIYLQAYDLGLKGCTTFRPNPITGEILMPSPEKTEDSPPQASTAPASPQKLSAHAFREPHAASAKKATASSTEGTIAPQHEKQEVVYLTPPLTRPSVLEGRTYKIDWPDAGHATYVTINDMIQEDGRRRPYEIFINTRDPEHYAWMTALTRMISAIFRRGGDVSFVVAELKAVFDPKGGHWVAGEYVPSLLAAIGNVVERHLSDIGFWPVAEPIGNEAKVGSSEPTGTPPDHPASGNRTGIQTTSCPACAAPGLLYQEGCPTCRSCGYSRCG